jgi:hypothetical protein
MWSVLKEPSSEDDALAPGAPAAPVFILNNSVLNTTAAIGHDMPMLLKENKTFNSNDFTLTLALQQISRIYRYYPIHIGLSYLTANKERCYR